MIAFVQPFGLHDPGGGARILRSLLEDAPQPFLSVCTSPCAPTSLASDEVHLSRRPFLGRVESTRFSKLLHIAKLDLLLADRFERRLLSLCREREVTAVHAIPHRIDFWAAFKVAQRLGIPYYLNVHDDLSYNLQHDATYLNVALEKLAHVWPRATGRIVISEAMGEAYCERYGTEPYTIVTDGLDEDSLLDQPRTSPPDRLHIYFMGALHLTYHANFETAFEALESIATRRSSLDVAFLSRGSTLPDYDTSYPTRNLPFAPQEEIFHDFESVDWLYLPLPFGEEYEAFWRYSLSTKLITYLGSGVPILYHGPQEAAAARLLQKHDAAMCVHSMDPRALTEALQIPAARRQRIARNALALGRRRFRREEQRRRFWELLDAEPSSSPALN